MRTPTLGRHDDGGSSCDGDEGGRDGGGSGDDGNGGDDEVLSVIHRVSLYLNSTGIKYLVSASGCGHQT